MNGIGVLNREKTAFVLMDIQDRLLKAVHNPGELVSNSNLLIESSKIMGIPLIVTEQYPKGLGSTSEQISLPTGTRPVEKISFSCFGADDFVTRLKDSGAESIVLFGVEAHICILKTALDALQAGLQVHVVADAIASRKADDKTMAIERMRQSGVFVSSAETVLFQLMDRAGTDEFKAVSRLLK